MSTLLTLDFGQAAFDVLTKELGAGADRTPALPVELRYTEEVELLDGSKQAVRRTQRVDLVGAGETVVALGKVLDDVITVALLHSDGTESSTTQVKIDHGKARYAVTLRDVERLVAELAPTPHAEITTVTRRAQFVAITPGSVDFGASRLSVAVVKDATVLATSGPLAAFDFDAKRMAAVQAPESLLQTLIGVGWIQAHVGVDGRFSPRLDKDVGIGWVWWLAGPSHIVGFVPDDLSIPAKALIVIPVPGSASEAVPGLPATRVIPSDVTEAEVANNPAVYAEDPGAFCKPFSNPERVLSEKSFAVVARIQQPEISAMGSIRTRTQHLLDLDPTPAAPIEASSRGRSIRAATRPSADVVIEAMLDERRPRRYVEPPEEVEEKTLLPTGRSVLDSDHPLQWEDDIAQYQAATVALGHILEFRVRTRSNGYSLGHVASTLTLAPRQTKRIQKISYERLEQARRSEATQLADRVSDEVTRERDYSDTVAANLSEWAKGSSKSGSAAVAGGVGFAVPPVVGGVGGGASKAWSESEQSGGRNTTASEEQRLRDAIRRHGDALRRFESTVVTEISHEETVTGTTEIVRNPNYGHSLTVIYYEILRHLKVSTEFAGVRECLFIPFSIKSFTLQRAYRWREAIGRYLRDPYFGRAMKYLRDVVTGFQFSNVLPGMRSQQPLKYLRGSVYVTLAVERPADKDGAFDALQWQPLSMFLGSPAQSIWARLAANAEALRDQIFQREHAPTIAAKWCDRLVIKIGNADLQADCTLATRYAFNNTVRVDFSIPPAQVSSLTRAQLATLQVEAGARLPAGSVANVTRMSLRYGTLHFERSLESPTGIGDLIKPETGLPDNGAQLDFPLDAWDYVDERQQMMHSANELIEHLNEHVEFYHKAVWWSMDRDRLLMMLDGFYVPGTNKVSIATVVDREPVAIIGNSLVYQVGAATYIGYDKVNSPRALHDLYASKDAISDPILVSLPTDGLYAQTIMDECVALEEHKGTLDWVLDDPDPELGTIDPSLMGSRSGSAAGALSPTTLPATIINLQNAPDAPAPAGLQDVLNSVTNANAFRDMAGLAGTQANSAAAFSNAANLATTFGNQAAAIKLADMAATAKATEDADQQLASVRKAKGESLISDEEANQHANKILDRIHTPAPPSKPRPLNEDPAVQMALDNADTFNATRSDEGGTQSVAFTAHGVSPQALGGFGASVIPARYDLPPEDETTGLEGSGGSGNFGQDEDVELAELIDIDLGERRNQLSGLDSLFRGARGERLRKRVSDIAQEFEVDPESLAMNVAAEEQDITVWLSNGEVLNTVIGLDFWHEERARVFAAMPAGSDPIPSRELAVGFTNEAGNPTGPRHAFPNSLQALRALAARLRFAEQELEAELGAATWGALDRMTRQFLVRLSFNSGPNSAGSRQAAADVRAGKDPLIRQRSRFERTGVGTLGPRRAASIRAVQAAHLRLQFFDTDFI